MTTSDAQTTEPTAAPLQTALVERHRSLGARLIDFAGWEMPVQYPTGILEEHEAVRERVGLFDLSHMGEVWVSGPGARRSARLRAGQRSDPARRPAEPTTA